uniref:Thioredoxin domain-containing protein n=1 Tax=Octactis speculum TaxID=3111310 RepID=A0A7S2ME33_9STRA|mmetsp:Transcript_60477/g.82974  ORF Transcript_60477/g.82974 Transcript_60477/m.82974 type:complete len:311 (+) Transcript_60477:26-958(+)|eukprot:CAMPEP_0185776582 /NCGR_PEP_ID=MMETSP1174-20130828/86233_1 /TAXON_ID=35687 /ORGANISM="Dictyocha speculum, Strain CCMP1381" /LENGTH=310 /DNA_ID=CAMNT_0028464601 /DNA_START=26 /DNA_END=958 /DNA_ORIENTATION=-
MFILRTLPLAAVMAWISLTYFSVDAAEGKVHTGVVNMQFAADAKDLLKDNEVALIVLFDPDNAEQKKMRTILRRVGQSEEFEGVGVAVADSTEQRLLEHFQVTKEMTPFARLYRPFDANGDRPDQQPQKPVILTYDGPWEYSALKSFLYKESLPPVLRLGAMDKTTPALAARTFMSFRQETISKFMVLHHGPLAQETYDELLAYGLKHRDVLSVICVDMSLDRAKEIGHNLLHMSGLERDAVHAKMERPLSIFVGSSATLVYDGFYEAEPLDWFFNDWMEQGAGGCSGTWKDKKKGKKSKKKRKAAKKEL